MKSVYVVAQGGWVNATYGLGAGVGECVGVDIDGLALDLVGPAGVVTKGVDGHGHVAAGHGDGLAVVERLDGGQEVEVLLGDVGELVQHGAALFRGDPAPLALEGLAGGSDGDVDILLGGLGDGADDLLGRGVDDLKGLLVDTVNPLVVDEAGGRGHA